MSGLAKLTTQELFAGLINPGTGQPDITLKGTPGRNETLATGIGFFPDLGGVLTAFTGILITGAAIFAGYRLFQHFSKNHKTI